MPMSRNGALFGLDWNTLEQRCFARASLPLSEVAAKLEPHMHAQIRLGEAGLRGSS
jgi:hypothetical protein